MPRSPVVPVAGLGSLLLAAALGCTGEADGSAPERAAADTVPSSSDLPAIAEDAPTRFPVRIDGAWGYVDASGRLAVEPRFERAEGFHENRAAVRVNGRWGYVDTTGAVVVEPRFGAAGRFSEGLAAVAAEPRGLHGYIDAAGEMVIDPRFPLTHASIAGRHFRHGLAPVQRENPKGLDPFGFIDRRGAWVVEPRFRIARPFSEGLAAVQTVSPEGWAYVDTAGATVLEGPWDGAGSFSEGLAAVDTATGFGRRAWRFIDRTGAIALRPTFGSGTSAPERAEAFSEGLALIYYDGPRQYVYITASGENADFVRVERYRWFEEAASFRGGRARVVVQGRDEPVYIDRDGRVIWPRPDAADVGAEAGGAGSGSGGPSTAAPRDDAGADLCRDADCFEAAVAACRPARYRTGRALGGRAVYEVLGDDEGAGCRLQLTYTANPDPAWVDTPLRFTLEPAPGDGAPVTPRLRAAVEACLTGEAAGPHRCGGPLARELATAPTGGE